MITKLTKKQIEKMYEYRDEGIKIARDTTPINHSKLEDDVRSLYFECGLNSDLNFKYYPFFEEFFKDSSIYSSINSSIDSSIYSSIFSSIDSSIRSSILLSIHSSIDSSIRSSIHSSIHSSIRSSIHSSIRSSIWWGQYNIDSLKYYEYYNNVIGFKAKNQKLLNLLISISKNSHILFFFKDLVVAIERPVRIEMEGNLLHSFDRMAVEYPNGKGFYLSHNVKMPEKYIKTPSDKISVNTILKEENVEVRRELLRKVGIENFIAKSKAKVLDSLDDYVLYKVKLGKDKFGNYLKMKNPSLDNTFHFEGVSNECDTVEKALAWRDSEVEYIKPISLS